MERPSLKRVGLAIVIGLAAAFAFLSLVSHSPTDPPNPHQYQHVASPLVANKCGIVGAHLSSLLLQFIGAATSYVLIAVAILWAGILVISRPVEKLWLKGLGVAGLVIAFSATIAWLDLAIHDLGGMENQLWGGVLGVAGAHLLVKFVSYPGSFIILLGLVGLTAGLATDLLAWRAAAWAAGRVATKLSAKFRGMDARGEADERVAVGEGLGGEVPVRRRRRRKAEGQEEGGEAEEEAKAKKGKKEEEVAEPGDEDLAALRAAAEREAAEMAEEGKEEAPVEIRRAAVELREAPGEPEFINAPSAAKPDDEPKFDAADITDDRAARESEYRLPGIDLLDESMPVDSSRHDQIIQDKARVLEKCLEEFQIPVKVVSIDTGPVVTLYELELAPGIKVGRIIGLSDDMAMALKAPAVRIVAPIPGKSTVGVEVPNIDKEVVQLREIMDQGSDAENRCGIPLYLGKDAAGTPIVVDMTDLPHLMIAGETGSGKSVCINSVILSILMTRTPHQVKLLLVDPKMVELSIFKDIPHLLSPVVTDTKKTPGVLAWAEEKMDERYRYLSLANVRNVAGFNRLGAGALRERLGAAPDEELDIPAFLPYIVIVIDELADLMMLSAKEIEPSIIRLAQKSRAVGIHLVLATQRPSVDVITGLIKSNLPARIAFRVAAKVDSRTILDQNGAEKLLGKGDMLFLQPGTSKLIRAQGTFVSDDEIRRVVEFAKSQMHPDFSRELVQADRGEGFTPGERDPLYDDAVRVVLESQRGSVSLLQRRLEIGYSRAARLVDFMAEDGIVGSYKGSQAREVLFTLDEWEARPAATGEEA